MMQKEIEQLKGGVTNKDAAVESKVTTAVLGGLAALTSTDEAWTWVSNKLWHLHGPQPTEVYSKGDFRGIVFLKFRDKADRDEAVKLLRQSSIWEGGMPSGRRQISP